MNGRCEKAKKARRLNSGNFRKANRKILMIPRICRLANPKDKFIYRVYTVFNASQIDGIPAHIPRVRQEWEVNHSAETILQNSGARIIHDQQDRAFYSRLTDDIHLPPGRHSNRPASIMGQPFMNWRISVEPRVDSTAKRSMKAIALEIQTMPRGAPGRTGQCFSYG